MPRDQYTGPAATFANMRSQGVRSVLIYCVGNSRCWHRTTMNADAWPDDATFADIEPRLVCTACGLVGQAHARPNWHERPERQSLVGRFERALDQARADAWPGISTCRTNEHPDQPYCDNCESCAE